MGIAAVAIPSEPEPGGGPEPRPAQPRIASASVWRRPLVAGSDTDRLARRQANAAIVLFLLGSPDPLWRHLDQFDDPRLRSELIERLAGFEVASAAGRASGQLPAAGTVGPPGALLALAAIPPTGAARPVGPVARRPGGALWHTDPDRGVHSAAELVARWRLDDCSGGSTSSGAGAAPAGAAAARAPSGS